MSGFLGTLQAIGNVGGLNTLTSSVTLGSVTLTGQEVPDSITGGGAQAIAVHKYIGGARSIDSMGRDDADLSWSGILLGPGAEARMLQLDALRTAGQVIALSYGTMSILVVVSDFKGEYRRTNYCLYNITCTVLADNAQPAGKTASPLSALVGSDVASSISSITGTMQQVSTDVSDVASVAENSVQTVENTVGPVAAVFGVSIYSKLQGVNNALLGVQSTTDGLSAIANAPNAIAGTITSLQAAGSQIITTLGSAESTLTGVAAAAPSGGIVASTGDLFSAITASSTIGGLTTAAGYLNRSGANLATQTAANQSPSPESIVPLSTVQ